MWSYKDHGKSWRAVYEREHPPGFRWLHESFGTNWRMMEMQAAIGRLQLKRVDAWAEKRTGQCRAIAESCRPLRGGARSPAATRTSSMPTIGFDAFVPPGGLGGRLEPRPHRRGDQQPHVPCYHGSCPEVYLEKAFDGTGLRPAERLPVAKLLGETSLMFLVHPTLTEAEIAKTCTVVQEVLRLASRWFN